MIFPQLAGLGISPTSQFYGIRSLEEAADYFAHPILGTRLTQCTEAVLVHRGLSLIEIFGFPDNLKFCSSMTLFSKVSGSQPLFRQAIDTFCDGIEDEKTIAILERMAAGKAQSS